MLLRLLCGSAARCKLNNKFGKFNAAVRQFRRKYGEEKLKSNFDVDIEERGVEFPEERELRRSTVYIRNALYPCSEDEVVNELKNCPNAGKVLEIVGGFDAATGRDRLCEALLVLRDVQIQHRTLANFHVARKELNFFPDSAAFEKLLHLIDAKRMEMSFEELSCCLLYSSFLMEENEPSYGNQDILKNLVEAFEMLLKRCGDSAVTISSLTRVCIALRKLNDIWSLYTLNNLVPIVYDKLLKCENYSDLRHIVVCLQKMTPLLQESTGETCVNRCYDILMSDCPPIDMERSRTILELAILLNMKIFNYKYSSFTRDLFGYLRGNLDSLSINELLSTHKMVYKLQEPFHLITEISQMSEKMLATARSGCINNMKLALVATVLPSREERKLQERKDCLEDYLLQDNISPFEFPSTLQYAYIIIYKNKIYDPRILRAYWNRVLRSFRTYPHTATIDNIAPICKRYLTRSLKPNCRAIDVENAMLELLEECVRTIPATKLNHYATYVLFTLAVNDDMEWRSPGDFKRLTETLLECAPRLSVTDNLNCAFFLNGVTSLRKRGRRLTAPFLHFYTYLRAALNENNLFHLKMMGNNPNVELISHIFCAFCYCNGDKKSELFGHIYERIEKVCCEELGSKVVRNVISNSHRSGCLLPKFTDVSLEYCLRRGNHCHPTLVWLVLTNCYNFGYYPERSEAVLEWAVKLLHENKEDFPSFIVVKYALTLCFFKWDLPLELVGYIFSVPFLKKFDRDIETKNAFRSRKFNEDLMELNRSVCVDYPHYNIPWFHQRYCKDKIVLERYKGSSFYDDVFQYLQKIAGEGNVITDHFSPYGHKIDFLINLNERDEVVINSDARNHNAQQESCRKIAILLIDDVSGFSILGKWALNSRHLEMLNYKVIGLKRRMWNAMHMSEPCAKSTYLYSQIWP